MNINAWASKHVGGLQQQSKQSKARHFRKISLFDHAGLEPKCFCHHWQSLVCRKCHTFTYDQTLFQNDAKKQRGCCFHQNQSRASTSTKVNRCWSSLGRSDTFLMNTCAPFLQVDQSSGASGLLIKSNWNSMLYHAILSDLSTPPVSSCNGNALSAV